jgi:Spy/CpxP family protein refolding chaperone
MSGTDSGSPPPRRRRWLVPLLVASVAVNLVIVGAAVSGQVWPDHDDGRKSSHRSADLMPRSFFRALDEERREELVEVFRARKTEWREERRALGDAAAALADALEGEPFEAPQAQSAIADHAARSHQLVDLGAAVATDLVEALTPEERRDLAQAIRQRIEEDRHRRARRER